MNSLVRPELPTAALRSSQATLAAVDNSAPLANRPESTYKSGKVVQTTGATSAGSGGRLLAKRVRITGPDRHETNLVLYGGDEQYIVRPESFSPLRQSGRGQGTKP